MNGLVLSDSEIIEAMEQGARGRFIPASLNRDGTVSRTGSTLSDEELRTVMHYCKRLIATMGRALKQGDAEARPCMVNRNACKFCPYRTVCGKELMDRDILQDNAGNAQVLARMREGREG